MVQEEVHSASSRQLRSQGDASDLRFTAIEPCTTGVALAIADHEEKNISYVYVGLNDGMKIEHHKLSYNELVSFIKKIQPLCLV